MAFYDRNGDEFVLHKVPFPYQCDDKDEFVIVRITESQPVKGTWGGETHSGYKGVSFWSSNKEYGNHYFTCNWKSFPDDSMSPMWTWYDITRYEEVKDGGKVDYDWYDITQGLHDFIPGKPKCLDWFKDLKFCKPHNRLYIDDDGTGCISCKFNLDEVPQGPKYWNGWND